jgi:hypothetical protein
MWTHEWDLDACIGWDEVLLDARDVPHPPRSPLFHEPGYAQRSFLLRAGVTGERRDITLLTATRGRLVVFRAGDGEMPRAVPSVHVDADDGQGGTEELGLALGTIVSLMKRSTSIDQAVLLMLDGDDVVAAGTWSPRSTSLWPGARLHLTANSLEPMLRRTGSVFSGEAMDDGFLPILDRVLAASGSRCWVSCPLLDGGAVVGTLVFGSTVPGSLCPSQELYFRTVASQIESDLIRLGRRSLRQLTSAEAPRRSA